MPFNGSIRNMFRYFSNYTWQNTDTNGGSRMPYVMGNVGGEKHGFDINWVNCGALMNQFFGNKRTMLFARREDIQYAPIM
jgi:hypothetical protein